MTEQNEPEAAESPRIVLGGAEALGTRCPEMIVASGRPLREEIIARALEATGAAGVCVESLQVFEREDA